MGVNLKQNEDGSLGLQGKDLGDGGFVLVTMDYNASSTNKVVFVAGRSFRVKDITNRVETSGTDAGTVTASVKRAASGTALTSGTALHTSAFDLKAPAATNQATTLIPDLDIAAGESVAVQFSGTMTGASGVITVLLAPM